MPMQLIDRRRFLQLGLVSGAGAVAASLTGPGAARASSAAVGVGPALASSAPVGTRQLVVIDMAGGNDGLSMVPPIGNGTYHDLRPRTALDDVDILPLSGSVGMHPSLTKLHARGVGIVLGRRADEAGPVALRVAATLVGGRPEQPVAHDDGVPRPAVRPHRR